MCGNVHEAILQFCIFTFANGCYIIYVSLPHKSMQRWEMFVKQMLVKIM